MARRTFRRARHRCEYWGLAFLVAWIPQLPRAWVLRLAHLAGAIAYWVDGRGRRLGLENLTLAVKFGGLDLAGRSPREVIRASYANFAQNFLDLFWFANLTAEQAWNWVDVEGSDAIRELMRKQRGGIHITAHYGLFELSGMIVGFLSLPLHIIARDFRNVRLTEVFRHARECSGHQVHHRDGVMLKLLRLLRRGQHVAMLTDLSVPPQGAATVIRLFGIPASVTALHVELSKRCSAPIIAAICEPSADGRTTLKILGIFDPPADEVHRGSRAKRCELTQRIWDCFEAAIHRHPERWLWMYRHWKYRPEGNASQPDGGGDDSDGERKREDPVQFPSYAQPNAEFTRLIAKVAVRS